MQADGVGRDPGVALVHDCLAVEQREAAQRRDRLLELLTGECSGKRRVEVLASLHEQEQRDRFRRQQSGVHDQGLGRRLELAGLLDGEREGLRHGAPIVILGGRIAGVVEQPRRRGREALGIFGERKLQALAIGRRLLVREREAVQDFR
jgi:hypothetical protein